MLEGAQRLTRPCMPCPGCFAATLLQMALDAVGGVHGDLWGKTRAFCSTRSCQDNRFLCHINTVEPVALRFVLAACPDFSLLSTAFSLTRTALSVSLLAQALTALSVVLAVAWATHCYAPAAAKKVYLLDTFTYKPPDRCGCAYTRASTFDVSDLPRRE